MTTATIVQVSLSISSVGAARDNFGTPLLMAYHTKWPERSRLYSDTAGLLADGFTANDAVYKMAEAIRSQSKKVATFRVGRRALAFTQSLRLTPTVTTAGTIYTLQIQHAAGIATMASYTVPGGATIASICTALTSAINALSLGITLTNATTHIDIAANTAGAFFALQGLNKELDFKDNTPDPGIATDLAAVLAENDGWFSIHLDSQSELQLNAAAVWAQANSKLLVAEVSDSDAKSVSTTDVLSDAKTANYDFFAGWYRRSMGTGFGAGLAGRQLSLDPGASEWSHKTVEGQATDTLTINEQANILGKNGNIYVTHRGLPTTLEGRVASGKTISVIRDILWLRDELGARLYELLKSVEKVPYTQRGFDQVESSVRGTCSIAVNAGVLDSFDVEMPILKDVSLANRSNGIIDPITIDGQLAGSAIRFRIVGTLRT